MKRILGILMCLFVALVSVCAQNLKDVVIYINPGHGGFNGANDRNIVIYPFTQGDPNGFWESQSNLDKGLQLYDMLEKAGATVYISRTTNTEEDDLKLDVIVAEANAVGADFMLSIHSNAGVTNYILQLYAGIDPGDTCSYKTPTPFSDEGRAICKVIAANQYLNEANTWAASPTVRGDKTFARTAMGWSNGYGVLRGLAMPGCISEGSMHDYIPETYRLMNMDYKWLEAWHFYKSFCEYFEAGDIPTGNIVGTIHDSRNKNLATYVKIKGSKDELLPLHGAKVTVNPGNLQYTTDDLYNGVYVFKDLTPGTYEMITEAAGYVSDTADIVVGANKTSYYNVMLDMIRNTPPEVIAFSPDVSLDEPVACSSPVVFGFNWDVDEASAIEAFSIVPETEGTITFEDSQHRMIFTPTEPYDTSQVYTVTLSTALKHPANIHMEEDYVRQFLTKNRNRLEIIAYYPKAGDEGVHYTSPTFEFWFDEKIDPSTIRDAITVFDSQGNKLSKNARSVLNNKLKEPYGSNLFQLTSDLKQGETYTVKLNKAVVDVTNIRIAEEMEYTFRAVDVRVTDRPIVETFETAGIMAYTGDGSANVSSASFARNTSTKLFNSSSGLFKYAFMEDKGGVAIYRFTEPAVTANSTLAVGAHVYGDLTGNQLYLELKSEDNPYEYIPLTTMDFKGWEFAEADLSRLDASKSYTLTGIRVEQKDGRLTDEGSFYLDNILLYEGQGSSIKNIRVSDAHIVQDDGGIRVIVENGVVSGLELYSASGVRIRSTSQSELSTYGLPTGVYILKIILPEGEMSSTLLIK